MGQNFNQKFNGVVWEHNDEHIQAWKDGRTGYPIVDAGMRAMKAQGESASNFRLVKHADSPG